MQRYPTKEEVIAKILALENADKITKIKKFPLTAVLQWKTLNYAKKWRTLAKEKKLLFLRDLAHLLSKRENISEISVHMGERYCYNLATKELTLDKNNPSIISTLHEVGHHLYGENELMACAFSAQLFKSAFPREFKNLVWSGHMLKKKV